jgi:hypothetical protein
LRPVSRERLDRWSQYLFSSITKLYQIENSQLSAINCLRDPHGLAAAFGITPIFCAKAMKVGVLIGGAAAP